MESHAVGAYLRSQKDLQIPPFSSNVVDQAGVLRNRQAESLRSFLNELQNNTQSQVSVLIVRSLQGRAIEDYSIRVVDAWGIGQEQTDRGVLLLVAVDDRKMRIEVGQGLEGDIPDAYAKRIIDQNMLPFFKGGNLYEGIQSGVLSIVSLAEPEYAKKVFETSSANSNNSSNGGRKKKGASWLTILIFLLFFGLRGGLFGIFGMRRSGIFHGGGLGRSGGFGGGGFGGGGGGGFSGGGASGGW